MVSYSTPHFLRFVPPKTGSRDSGFKSSFALWMSSPYKIHQRYNLLIYKNHGIVWNTGYQDKNNVDGL